MNTEKAKLAGHFFSHREKMNNLVNNPWIIKLRAKTNPSGYFTFPGKEMYNIPVWESLEFVPRYLLKEEVIAIPHPSFFRNIEGFLLTFNHELGHYYQAKYHDMGREALADPAKKALAEFTVEYCAEKALEQIHHLHKKGVVERSRAYQKTWSKKITNDPLRVFLADKTFSFLKEYWREK